MARTRGSVLAAAKRRVTPRSGQLSQRPLKKLATDTDIESYPYRARARLVQSVLPLWKNTGRRRCSLKGLSGRMEDDFALKPGFEGIKKREVMGLRDAARVRKIRKLTGARDAEWVGEKTLPVIEGDCKRMSVLFGGEGEKKWVLGEQAKRALEMGIGESAVDLGVEIVALAKKKREERSARELKKETEFWGGYRRV